MTSVRRSTASRSSSLTSPPAGTTSGRMSSKTIGVPTPTKARPLKAPPPPEGGPARVGQGDRHEDEVPPAASECAERDAGGAGLHRREAGAGARRALREDGDGARLRQHLVTGDEGRLVAGRGVTMVDGLVLRAIDRDQPREREERPGRRDLPQRGLGDEV